jgi:tetratricopeptide (TPR) repeat protein
MVDENAKIWLERIQALNGLFDTGEIARARDESRRLLKDFDGILEVRFYCAGFLVDAGEQLQDAEATRQGIEIFESKVLNTPGRDACLARGYIVLADLEAGTDRRHWAFLENPAFQKGKRLLLDLAFAEDPTAPVWVWLATGHALSRVGREIEAIHAYEQALRVVPGAPLALGAKANSLRHLSSVLGPSEKPALEEAARLLRQALASPDLIRDGFPSAREHLQADLDEVVRLVGKAPETTRPEMEIAPEPGTVPPYLEQFLVYCRRWRLFLTYHLHDERVLPALGDTVFLSTIAAEGAASRFPLLAPLFNQIKEDFATARYLLFRALHPDDLQKSAAQMTGYAELADGSFCWLDNGLLKATFNLTYNTLDKLAFLANEYFQLGHDPERVTFKNFWKDTTASRKGSRNRKGESRPNIHPALRGSPNDAIAGLVDLSWDLSGKRFRRLEEIRHAQTHRCLVLLRRGAGDRLRAPGVVAVHRTTLERESVRLLRTVKAAIFSLAAAIDLEERRKLGPGGRLVRESGVAAQTHGEDADRIYSGM